MEDDEGVLADVSLVGYCSYGNRPQNRFEKTSTWKQKKPLFLLVIAVVQR